MSKATEDEIKKRLARSIPKQIPPTALSGGPLAVSAGARAAKVSVSLYPADQNRLDEIRAFMQSRGFRNLNDSECLRLACRAVDIGDGLVEQYNAMKGEDGRRQRSMKA